MSNPSLFPDEQARDAESLMASALQVIDAAFDAGAKIMLPLFSGGHDSLCACHVASKHARFTGEVHHINTGIGSTANRQFVDSTCRQERWTLRVYQSVATYERYVRRIGFPGPGSHQWVYNWLKDRCVSAMSKGLGRVALITGCRSEESARRMGHVEPVKVGETSKRSGKVRKRNRAWTAPCHDWSGAEQRGYMDYHALPFNPIKRTVLDVSGECFCGAFARPGELERIREICPDVAAEIDRLATIAAECGTPRKWGERPKGRVRVQPTGPLCHRCDTKMEASGLFTEDSQCN